MLIERKFKMKNPNKWIMLTFEDAVNEICAHVLKKDCAEGRLHCLWVAYDLGFHRKYETDEAWYRIVV